MTKTLKCDILLIPPEINPVFSEKSSFMPLGILALSSNLRDKGINSFIYRPVFRLFGECDFLKVAKHILLNKPRFIGFSTWCNTFATSVLVAKQIKSMNRNIPIIFGGPQASIIPIQILKEFSFIDFVLCGEADKTLPELLIKLNKKEKNLSSVSGLYFRNTKNEIIANHNSFYINDLDTLPIPAYDLIPKTKALKLDVGRGCPYQCTYCTTNNFFSKKYRTKSAERIIKEMEFAYERTKVSSFSFAHDMFTLNEKFVEEFCSKLIQISKIKKIKFKWTCSARIDCVSEELLIKMKAAGCHSIFFGVETGSVKIQKTIKKYLDLNKVLQVADICMREKINMYASFIIGFPDETKGDIEKTIELILKLACTGALVQISNLAVLPGTPLYLKFQNQLKFDGTFSNFSYSIFGKNELELIKKYPAIFSSFYYLPVKSLSHQSIILLTRLINIFREFRNTMFLIKDSVLKDIEEFDLLHIFEHNKNELKNHLYANRNSASLVIIRLLQFYLTNRYKEEMTSQIKNVFLWESTQNILKDKFLQWKLAIPNSQKELKKLSKKNLNLSSVTPTPIWQVLSTNLNLNRIIPEKNGWKNIALKRKFNYYYLLVATSGKNCKLIAIKIKEYELLYVLRNDSEKKFIEKAKEAFNSNELDKWYSYLIRTGILTQRNRVE